MVFSFIDIFSILRGVFRVVHFRIFIQKYKSTLGPRIQFVESKEVLLKGILGALTHSLTHSFTAVFHPIPSSKQMSNEN